MTDDSIVGPKCREIEQLLVSRFDASGKGLGELAQSVQSRLPKTLLKSIWHIASLRNDVVHDGKTLRDPPRFIELCNDVISDLKRPSGASEQANATAEFTSIQSQRVGERVLVRVSLTVYGLTERQCKVAAYFMCGSGIHLKNRSGVPSYSASDKSLTAYRHVTPRFPDARFSGLEIEIPVRVLQASHTDPEYSVRVGVNCDSKWLAWSEYSSFRLSPKEKSPKEATKKMAPKKKKKKSRNRR